ncbi:MAG: bacteriochlorophyll 4-vinyl reductase [Pseudomonadota bacterium]
MSTLEAPVEGVVGPNAIRQLRLPLKNRGGMDLINAMLDAAGLDEMPPPEGMIDQRVVARAHAALPRLVDDPEVVAREAGLRTADYIIANRIPRVAKLALRLMPRKRAKISLARNIARHAWTFAGSGVFTVASEEPLILQIAHNPLVGVNGCCWHVAVFTRLFQELADPDLTAREIACCTSGGRLCRFEIS